MFREKKFITEKIKKKKRSEIPELVVTVGIDVWNSTLALTRTAISGMDEHCIKYVLCSVFFVI